MHILLLLVIIIVLTLLGGFVIARFFSRTTLQPKLAGDGSDLLVFEQNGRYGFRDMDERVVIAPKFEDAGPFSEGVSAVKLNGKYGYILPIGDLALGWFEEFCGDFANGLAPLKKGGKAGYINRKGEMVIEHQWDYAGVFAEQFAVVGKAKRFGLIDLAGNVTIPLQFDEVRPVQAGLVAVRNADLWGVMFPDGKWLFTPQFHALGYFDNGKAVVRRKHEGELEEGEAFVDGRLEWNDNLVAANAFARKNAELVAATQGLVQYMMQQGCPCQFPRFRRLVRFQGAAVRCMETEALVSQYAQFLKPHATLRPEPGDRVTQGYFTCKVCGTDWRMGREKFGGNKQAQYLLVEEDHVEQSKGAQEDGLVPLYVGFDGPAKQLPVLDGYELGTLAQYLTFMRQLA